MVEREGLPVRDIVTDLDAEETQCPACLTKFKTAGVTKCPDCGLHFR
jgi:tRNA(Ile2) C34 agmatinyltransferase TiaS